MSDRQAADRRGPRTALLVIDMQAAMGLRIDAGLAGTTAAAAGRVGDLIALFRAGDLPVWHVHYDQPGTPFDLSLPSGAVMDVAEPAAHEPVFRKSASSAFAGTGLEAALRERGIGRLVICGGVAAFCVATSVRVASDLGFDVVLPRDALLSFAVTDAAGRGWSAEEMCDAALVPLAADFAKVTLSGDIAAIIGANDALMS